MRFVHLLVAAALALPLAAAAKSWQGITPGASTQADVTTRFGEPSTQGKLGGRATLVYRDDRAPENTRQAQFVARDDGVIAEINVFPATQLDREAVEGTYGKAAQKTFTDTFRPVWVYRALGVTVFFGKDGLVEALRFLPAAAPERGRARADDGAASPEAAAPPTR
jgi:hypothetical protein